MRRLTVTVVLATALVLAGCSGSDGSDAKDSDRDSTTSTSSESTSSTSTTATRAPCPAVGTTDTKDSDRPAVDQLLTDVTTTSDRCTDTVAFTFRPSSAPMPGFQVEYADPPFLNTAGQDMTPPGAAFLQVRFVPAWIADLSTEAATPTYTGPKAIVPPGARAVQGINLTDATEAVLTWVIGLDARRPFTVSASPGKAVVTIG